jgi:hypothetical protein
MKLTGNSLEQFEKWYKECYDKENLPYIQGFYASSFSIQYGVLVDFFESVGLYLGVDSWATCGNVKETFFWFNVKDSNQESLIKDTYQESLINSRNKTRPQARTKAIEKANDLYNKR